MAGRGGVGADARARPDEPSGCRRRLVRGCERAGGVRAGAVGGPADGMVAGARGVGGVLGAWGRGGRGRAGAGGDGAAGDGGGAVVGKARD